MAEREHEHIDLRGRLLWTVSGALALLIALAPAAGTAVAEDGSDLPPNAHRLRYGDAWGCNRGYLRTADSCVVIEVPANAYLDSVGRRWSCERGYEQVDSTCKLIQVPANGFLDGQGSGWACEHGFRKLDSRCEKVEVQEVPPVPWVAVIKGCRRRRR